MIRRVAWSDDLSAAISVSGGDDLPEIIRQIKAGICKLWHCQDGDSEGYIVTRLERDVRGFELCLVLGEGKGFARFAPVFLELARKNGWRFRTHVKRKGLVRMWKRLGVELDNYILRAENE